MIFLLFGLFVSAPALMANEDTPDYQTTVNPGFSVTNKDYDQFETGIYEMETAVNNMVISVDTIKSESCLFRAYARFRYAKTGLWTRYMAFDSEYHFCAVDTV